MKRKKKSKLVLIQHACAIMGEKTHRDELNDTAEA
jgi:hypothetical protein